MQWLATLILSWASGEILLAAAGLFAVLLGLFPIVHHLWFGLSERKREITDLLDDRAVRAYFDQFYHARADELKGNPRGNIEDIYDRRFGARTFMLPGIVYAVMLGLSVLTLMSVVGAKLPGKPTVALVEPVAASALAGAYLWVVYDLVARYRQRNLVPSALYWGGFRIAIAIPLAYAFAAAMDLSDAKAGALAFFLGVFPTSTVILIARRSGEKLLKYKEKSDAEKKPELETLQGVDQPVREAFSDVGVTTILQLAYDDPIQLAMRTNLSFFFVLDLVSQALVAIYISAETARHYSVRGSVEATTLYQRCLADDADSRRTLEDLAKALQLSKEVLSVILFQISEDPCSKFIGAIWEGTPATENQGNPPQVESGDGPEEEVLIIRTSL